MPTSKRFSHFKHSSKGRYARTRRETERASRLKQRFNQRRKGGKAQDVNRSSEFQNENPFAILPLDEPAPNTAPRSFSPPRSKFTFRCPRRPIPTTHCTTNPAAQISIGSQQIRVVLPPPPSAMHLKPDPQDLNPALTAEPTKVTAREFLEKFYTRSSVVEISSSEEEGGGSRIPLVPAHEVVGATDRSIVDALGDALIVRSHLPTLHDYYGDTSSPAMDPLNRPQHPQSCPESPIPTPSEQPPPPLIAPDPNQENPSSPPNLTLPFPKTLLHFSKTLGAKIIIIILPPQQLAHPTPRSETPEHGAHTTPDKAQELSIPTAEKSSASGEATQLDEGSGDMSGKVWQGINVDVDVGGEGEGCANISEGDGSVCEDEDGGNGNGNGVDEGYVSLEDGYGDVESCMQEKRGNGDWEWALGEEEDEEGWEIIE